MFEISSDNILTFKMGQVLDDFCKKYLNIHKFQQVEYLTKD